MIRDRLRGLRDRLLAAGRPRAGGPSAGSWAPEPTYGAGTVELPDGRKLERSALLGVEALPGAVLRPGRLTLQHHWATWAPAVEQDIPILLELHLAWAQYVDFFGVGWELLSGALDLVEAGLEVDAFHRSFGLTWRTLIVQGNRNRLRELTGLQSEILPQTWLRDGKGKVVYLQEGALDDSAFEEMQAVIRSLTGVVDDPRP